jgi:hypothetical protein
MNRDYRDIAGGLLLAAIGLGAALYASGRYDLGTLSEMGPGMFPAAIGYTLLALGLLIALPAFFRAGVFPPVAWRELVTILAGMLLFALTVDRFGGVPALALLIGCGCLARPNAKLVESIVLYAVITVSAILLFVVGLGIPLPLFAWEP